MFYIKQVCISRKSIIWWQKSLELFAPIKYCLIHLTERNVLRNRISNLQYSVSWMQTAIFNCCTSRQNILYKYRARTMYGGVPGDHSKT